MKYLPLIYIKPEDVSSALWKISRPDSDTNQTKLYCSWITHPETGQHALSFIEDDTQPIHPEADQAIAAFVGLVRPIVGEAEADALQTTLTNAKGSRVNVLELLPPTISANLITPEQAQEAGWFIDLEIPPM